MQDDSLQVILVRLSHMDKTLAQIHEEVKRTNGRVISLEMEQARWEGEFRAKRLQRMIIASAMSGGILAAVIWFVGAAI